MIVVKTNDNRLDKSMLAIPNLHPLSRHVHSFLHSRSRLHVYIRVRRCVYKNKTASSARSFALLWC